VYQVADGHQRLSAWLAKYGKAAEIDARLASRPLTETERRKIAIYSRQIGAWDWDTLSAWDDPLIEWGLDADLLGEWGRDYSNLAEMLGVVGEELTEARDADPQEVPEDYSILIECSSEIEQFELLEKFIQDGLKCRALIS